MVAEPALLLDTSALLALAFQEPGKDVVLAALDGAAIGAVNQVEVIEVAARQGIPQARAAAWASELSIPVLAFTAPMAVETAALLGRYRARGLSLGDCACLATAAVLGVPVLTADRPWATLGLPIEVRWLR
jgi:ribonuclease VapC